jgi:hypothetical protein
MLYQHYTVSRLAELWIARFLRSEAANTIPQYSKSRAHP